MHITHFELKLSRAKYWYIVCCRYIYLLTNKNAMQYITDFLPIHIKICLSKHDFAQSF